LKVDLEDGKILSYDSVITGMKSRLHYRSGTSASNFFIILSALSEYPPYEKVQLRVWTSHQTAYAKQKGVIQIVI